MKLREQIARFGIVGTGNTVLGLSVIFLLQYLGGFTPFLANAVGYAAGFVVGYHLHRSWTFAHTGPIRRSAPLYAVAIATSYLINLSVLGLALRAGSDPYVAQVLGVLSYAIAHFALGRLIAFR